MKTDQKYRSGKQEFPVLWAANGFPYRNENAQLLNYRDYFSIKRKVTSGKFRPELITSSLSSRPISREQLLRA
jgi:hypothetical protein